MRIRILSSLIILAGVLILTSCSTPEVIYGTYLMPPQKVTDVRSLQILEVVQPNLEVNAQQIDPSLTTALPEELSALIAGNIEAQGFYKTADALWCKNSTDHYSKLNMFFRERNRQGYDSFSDYGQNNKPAKLTTDAKITITKTEGVDTVTKSLTTVPYSRKTSKDGSPYSIPNHKSTTTTKVVTKIPFIKYQITGTINVKVVTAGNSKVYEKKSGVLTKTFKIGGKGGRKTIPAVNEMLAALFGSYVKQVVKDISPYTETKPLIINEDGDEKAVMLLKAQAYSEALTRLDEVISTARKAKEKPEVADLYNFAITLEAVGEYSDALSFYNEAIGIDPDNLEIKNAKKRLTNIYKAKKKLYKSKVKEKNASYKTKENKQR